MTNCLTSFCHHHDRIYQSSKCVKKRSTRRRCTSVDSPRTGICGKHGWLDVKWPVSSSATLVFYSPWRQHGRHLDKLHRQLHSRDTDTFFIEQALHSFTTTVQAITEHWFFLRRELSIAMATCCFIHFFTTFVVGLSQGTLLLWIPEARSSRNQMIEERLRRSKKAEAVSTGTLTRKSYHAFRGEKAHQIRNMLISMRG